MNQLYKSIDIVNATGCAKASITLWAIKGWVKPCRLAGERNRQRELFFSKAEFDRIAEAVRSAEGHPRKVGIFLNRTLHMATVRNAITWLELADRCGCCFNTLRKAMESLGHTRANTPAVLEEDVDEVKAMLEKFREESQKSRSEKQKAAWRNHQLAVKKPESTGSITLHIKGLTISLSRKDAEALAEELLEQF